MRLLSWVLVNTLAVAAAAWLLGGIEVTGDTTADRALTLVGVGIILGLINAVVRPVVNLLSLPFIVLSLGLGLVVINALMLLLASNIADGLDLGFTVDGFWTAVAGAIVISIAGIVVESLLPEFD